MELYQEIAEKIKEADGILIGASNGLSIAEGYNIFANDERFQRHFSDFQQKYRFQSMIQGSFGRFASENEMWSYCSRMACYYAYPRHDGGDAAGVLPWDVREKRSAHGKAAVVLCAVPASSPEDSPLQDQ